MKQLIETAEKYGITMGKSTTVLNGSMYGYIPRNTTENDYIIYRCTQSYFEDTLKTKTPIVKDNIIFYCAPIGEDVDFISDVERALVLSQLGYDPTKSDEENFASINAKKYLNIYKKGVREDYENSERIKKDCKQAYMDASKEAMKAEAKLLALNKYNEKEKELTKNLLNIINHPKVSEVKMQFDFLEIKVKDVITYEPLFDKWYKIPDTRISLNLVTGDVYFYPLDESEGREGYWGKNQCHPHVSDTGKPCLGNAVDQILFYISEMEYYAAFLTALNFLQSVNIEDIAGAGVCRWDECDVDGNIIREGHNIEEGEYGDYTDYEALRLYGDYVQCPIDNQYYPREEMVECEECGELIYEGNAQLVDGNHICDVCFEQYYYTCENCGEPVHCDNVMTHDFEGYYCSECYEELFDENGNRREE